MRLARLTLERYGPFERLDLPLDAMPGRVNLIVAPNGFGKSVLRRAIGDMLFGIPGGTPMDFRHGTERMRLLADVAQQGSAVLSLVRRKGRGNTLARADGSAVSTDEARQLLGGADETVFRELFGLDTALLRSGGQELIRSQGRLGQVLFAAGGGMGRVRDVLTALETQRDELGRATVRHKARPLWSALTAWEKAGTDLRQVALRPEGWSKLERDAAEAATQLETLLSEQAAGASERDRLRATGAIRPWLDRLHGAQLTLEAAGQAPELDDTFERRWREALEAGAKSASAADAAGAAVQAIRDARATMTFDADWLAAEAEIDALAEMRGRAQGAEADLPRLQAELAAGQAEGMKLRRDLGWDATLPLPPAPAVKDAQKMLQSHPTLAAQAVSVEQTENEARRLLTATQAELDALPSETDVARLADLTDLLRAGGDPAVRLATGQRRLRAAETALAAALAAIPDCPLPEAMLGVTVAPSEPRLDAADKALSQADAAHQQAVRDRSALTNDTDAVRAELATLERTAMLPAADALDVSRQRRDAALVQLCAATPERPDPAAAVTLDRAIRAADAVADALIAHAQEAAEAGVLRDRLAALEGAFAATEQKVVDAADDLAKARGDLAAIAAAAGGDAREMAALRAFLRGRAEAVIRRGERDDAAAAFADTKADLARLGALLAEAMQAPTPPVEALEPLLAEAGRRIEAARNLAARRGSLAKLAGEQRLALTASHAAADEAERALADWHERWTAVAQSLSRPPDEAQAAAAEALATVEALRLVETGCRDGARRIADMQGAVALLAEKIAALARLSPQLAGLPPIDAAGSLQHRLAAERREAVRCQDADQRMLEAQAKHLQSLAEAGAATLSLTGLRAALHAETDEAAEVQLQRARDAAAARKDAAEALREIAVQGGGRGIEALRLRSAETTAEEDAARIRAIETRHTELTAAIEIARQAKAAAVAARDQASTGLDAGEAAHRREAAQAMLARTAEEALVLHAAHALLQAALDRQAAAADQPLLRRIGMVFRTITGGAHAGVAIEEGKAGQVMMALEADGLGRKPLDQLSEGTSDQLYLALRIAALENYAAAAAPLPFIVDDVLQTFDDTRTLATLQALLGLSAYVQVIALTHHPHVGNLAANLSQEAMHVIRLGN